MHTPRYLRTGLAITVALALLLPAMKSAGAESVLDYLPEDTLAFAVVNDLSDVDAKVGRLQQTFDIQFPSPLTYLKYMTGLDEGFDEDGSLMVALIASPTPQAAVWLAVSDYAHFARSIGGDPSGAICRVELAGETVLVARKGPYAIFTNTEHRQRMQQLLTLDPQPLAPLQPLATWMASSKIAIAMLPNGIETYLKLSRARIKRQSIRGNIRPGRARMSWATKQLQHYLELYDILFDSNFRKIEVAAIGLQMDDTSNLRVGCQLLLAEPPTLENPSRAGLAQKPPFEGFSEHPFVAVASSTVSDRWGPACAKAIYYLLEEPPSARQAADASDSERRAAEEEIFLSMVRPVRSLSALMQPGGKKEPFFSNFYLVLTVDSATNYLETFAQAIERWNALTRTSDSDIKILYEVKPTTFAEAKAQEIFADVAEAANDPNVPLLNWMLEALFGEDGKFRFFAVAAEQNTIVLGFSSREKTSDLIEKVKTHDAGLNESPEVKTTTRLLGREADATLLVSPRGVVQWFARFVKEYLSLQEIRTPEIPEYPASPPVGIAFRAKHARVEVEMVWPAETLEGLAEFVQKVKSQ